MGIIDKANLPAGRQIKLGKHLKTELVPENKATAQRKKESCVQIKIRDKYA